MLLGQYKALLTQKGRLAVPARFRNELGNRLVVTKWVEGCLVLISEKRLNEILEKLLGKREVATLPVREVERFILGSAFETELDTQGRFVVPSILKDYAKITGEVYFIGLGDRVEIWNSLAWQKKEKDLQAEAGKFIEKLVDVDADLRKPG